MIQHALEQAAEFLDSWLALRARQAGLPGFAVAVAHQDTLVFEGAYGLADVAQDEPLTPRHYFSIGSQSKMFTATAVMQLVERGKIDLSEPVSTYLPWLAQAQDKRLREVTIRHLLSHTAGLSRDGADTDFWQLLYPFPDGDDLRRIVQAAGLVFPPGMRLKYSNIGYALLGQAIQQVTSLPYHVYVREHVLEPLQLGLTLRPKKSVSTGYVKLLDGQREANSMPIPAHALAPAVGWYATAADMCRFMTAHMATNTAVLSRASKEAMQRSQPVGKAWKAYPHITYGLGIQQVRLGGQLFLGHGGSFLGHRTCTYFDPRQNLSVCILANAQDAPYMQMFRGVIQAVEFFLDSVGGAVPPELRHYNLQLASSQSLTQLVATDKRIVAFHPQDWLPFTDPIELHWVSPTTLRVKRAHPFLAPGEEITLTYKDAQVTSVQFMGSTMTPLPKHH